MELACFEAVPTEAGVRLAWTTLSETSCFGFHALRSRDSQELGVMIEGSFVRGAGTSTVRRDYSFLDTSVRPGVWFYRLVQTDLSGVERVYGPVRVTFAPGPTSTWGEIKSRFNE